MKALAQKLLGLISESLGLPSSCIVEAGGEFYQNISINYYPPCPQPDLTLGLQAHSDMGAITLLTQDDVGGLQVFKDDEWITVHPSSDAIFVILSDQTENDDNDKLDLLLFSVHDIRALSIYWFVVAGGLDWVIDSEGLVIMIGGELIFSAVMIGLVAMVRSSSQQKGQRGIG
ncbi:hypothetical protein RJ639_018694 [Escallonia herrerae]|uniref:Fe2OG dioxygenase domain-containing protein n=1 Tax=Escallonia herrerae TaxID=1293975 RepID=A0AA88V842_9ASTE|nr:hypothetical protein RJ639_018694 [Escallonia herrerae]